MAEAFWAEIGPWGLASVFVMLVMTGLLIPRWTHLQRVGDRDKQIELLQKALDKRDVQVDLLIQQNNVTIKLLEDIKRESTVRRRAPT